MGILSFFAKDFYKKNLGLIKEINELEAKFEKLNSKEILSYSLDLKKVLPDKEISKELRVAIEAFALVRETAKRTLKQRPFDVQVLAGLALHQGRIIEMLTGEGKTLAATFPAYLNGLSSKGVHIITVNDYLAQRDAVWMGQIYHALGLSVGCIVHEQAFLYNPEYSVESKLEIDKQRDVLGGFKVFHEYLEPVSRKDAYSADITYGTNQEFGFDYLRDHLVSEKKLQVQRPFHYAIIDEVDNILIDEARTPLIITAPDKQSSHYYRIFSQIVKRLEENKDYSTDEKLKTVSFLDEGINKVERILKLDNLFGPQNLFLVHYLQESLRAKAFFKKDKEYVVKNGEIVIVDEFTGRFLHGRRYSGGLHQAIEAKENISVKEENRILAQITIQNYFRLYPKIAGMTGTALTSSEEFHRVYNLETTAIPTNKPMIRKNLADVVYKTEKAKFKAIVEEIKKRHQTGQPLLVGTTSIEKNEKLSNLLNEENIPHQLLNAKNHEKEGEIIAQAGKKGAITVATNLAGRGVDIVLGGNPCNLEERKDILKLGGLHVIGTERHEARRIDNQLRGRSGRQGDPGSSQFFLCLEDDLLRVFGGEKLKNLMTFLKTPEDLPIESGLVSKAISGAQTKIEGINLDARRYLLDYDDVLNKQRNVIYQQREKILQAIEEEKIETFIEEIRGQPFEEKEKEKIKAKLRASQKIKIPLANEILRILDFLWIFHLETLDELKQAVSLRAYGQKQPIVEYREESYTLFKELLANFKNLVNQLFHKVSSIEKIK